MCTSFKFHLFSVPTDHVSLLHRSGELRQRKDLDVLSRRTRAGTSRSVLVLFDEAERRLLSAALNSPCFVIPGHLRPRRVVHLQSTATAGESGRGGLPEQETEYAH